MNTPGTATIVMDHAAHCMFLDFDGTLVEFADRPEAVIFPAQVRDDIGVLARRMNGALAVVSGRPVSDIDHFFAPLVLPVAGVHGLVRRDGAGVVHSAPFNGAALAALEQRLLGLSGNHDGLIVERKTGSVALHFRQRPELEGICHAAMDDAVSGLGLPADSLHVMHGKMVVEARASSATKAHAIAAFMNEPCFSGRVPVFAGDDVTDEDGFAEVNARNGLSIKVGAGPTCAQYRAESVRAFRSWLHDLVQD